ISKRDWSSDVCSSDLDENGNIKGLYKQVLKETDDGMVIVEGTERHWPADLVLLSIGFEGTEHLVPHSFNLNTDRNKIVANERDFKTNQDKIFVAGDARKGQSLVVWAIKEGREVAKAVDKALKEKITI